MNRYARARLLSPLPRRMGPVVLALLVASCGSGTRPAPYSGRVVLGPADSAVAAPTAPLPALPVSQMEERDGPTQRIQQLDVVDQDLRVVLRSLAESYGLDYQIDPTVTGRVTTRLHDVTLTEALDALVVPHGYTYQLQGRVLRITPSRLETRIFSLDYISMSRAGFGTTVIQRRLGATGSGGIGGATSIPGGVFGGGGGDVIQSVSVADLWEEIRISLEGLIFESAGPAGATTGGIGTAPAGALGGTGVRAPGAYSRVGEDGRRLILNPLSGTIVVSAPAEKLAEVAAFLATIEGSVQRQVLIEAKIVEVALNRRFQFGIDWSFVQRLGDLNLRLGAGRTGVEFTLGTQGDAERQIGVILTALEEQGDVSVLLSPQVSTLNNQRAMIQATTDEVFFSVTRQPVLGPNGGVISFNTEIQPQQIAVGIVLDVLPQIAPDNTITMNVRPEITDVIEVRTVQLEDGTQASAPVIDRRSTDTVVRVRSGETIVIGGLMTSKQRDQDTGIPGLRDVPVLGRVFGGRSSETEKRELVIFITPRIIASQAAVAGS